MPELLTAPWQKPDLGWINDYVTTAAKIAADKEARDQSMAAELAKMQEQKRQFDARADFDQQQQQLANRHFEAKMQFDAARELSDNTFKNRDMSYKAGRDRVLDARYDAENAPFNYSGQTFDETKTDMVPKSADDSFIKLSNYGYADDTTPDSNSARGIGHSDNKLEDGTSAALSKSLANRLGVKTGDWLNIQTTQGPMRVRYDDTVPDSDPRVNGPLPETIDIFRRNGSNGWGGKVTGIELEKTGKADLTPGQKVSNLAGQISQMNAAGAGIKNSDAASIFRATIPSMLREPRTPAEGLIFNDEGYAATKGGSVLHQMPDGRIVRTGSMPQQEVMDMRDRAIKVQEENAKPRAKALFKDPDGKIYTNFTDGSWDNEVPVGTSLTRLGEKDTKNEDAQKEVAALLREQKQWASEASSIDKALAAMGQPRAPIAENGKFYKTVAGEREAITKPEYDRLKGRADELSAEIEEKKRQRRDFLSRSESAQGRIDALRGDGKPAAPAAAPVAPAAPTAPAATPSPKLSVQDVISRGGKVKQDKAGVRYLFDEKGTLIGKLQ